MEYKKDFSAFQVGKLEEEVKDKARITSQILTTIEAKNSQEEHAAKVEQVI